MQVEQSEKSNYYQHHCIDEKKKEIHDKIIEEYDNQIDIIKKDVIQMNQQKDQNEKIYNEKKEKSCPHPDRCKSAFT
jgi:hypothetical protein